MALVARLVTFVDIDDSQASGLSFCARHDALLADGRRIVLLGSSEVPAEILAYVNRLSDFLFVAARAVNHRAGVAELEW